MADLQTGGFAGSGNVGLADVNTQLKLVNQNLASISQSLSAQTGTWLSWSPSITSSGGTITSVTVNAAQYFQLGKLVIAIVDLTLTNNGTGSGHLVSTLPQTALMSPVAEASGFNVTDSFVCGGKILSATTSAIYKYDGTYPGATGKQITFTIVYQAA